jgi:hypothetical protein
VQKDAFTILRSAIRIWAGVESNHGPPARQAGALSRLSYRPESTTAARPVKRSRSTFHVFTSSRLHVFTSSRLHVFTSRFFPAKGEEGCRREELPAFKGAGSLLARTDPIGPHDRWRCGFGAKIARFIAHDDCSLALGQRCRAWALVRRGNGRLSGTPTYTPVGVGF